MREFIEKLIALERDISAEKGEFELFAFFLREDALNKWDLIVSAPWLEKDKRTALSYLVKQLRTRFNPQEMLKLSRIVIIDQSNPGLKDVRNAIYFAIRVRYGVDVRIPTVVNNAVHAGSGVYEFQNCEFFGLQIKHAYIITSQKGDPIQKQQASHSGRSL